MFLIYSVVVSLLLPPHFTLPHVNLPLPGHAPPLLLLFLFLRLIAFIALLHHHNACRNCIIRGDEP